MLAKTTPRPVILLTAGVVLVLIAWRITSTRPGRADSTPASSFSGGQSGRTAASGANVKVGGRMEVINADDNVFKTANLQSQAVPDNILRLIDEVEISEAKVDCYGLKVYYREAHPPQGNFAKGEILLLHGQAFTSANWLEHKTIQTFAAAGYRVVAIDLPGFGQTGGPTLSNEQKPELVRALLESLRLSRPVLVSPSMSGRYSMPVAMRSPQLLRAFVPVAPTTTGDYTNDEYSANRLPTLVIYGERDTSLGIGSAANLKALPNGRVVKVPQAGHACYLDNPHFFHTTLLNFLDLVRSYA